MDAREFYEAVKKMRLAQRVYFATRSRPSLEESKRLEQVIDREIERVEKILESKRNPGLDI